jgi:hypothetical protein
MISSARRTKLVKLFAAMSIILSGSLVAFGQKICECGRPPVGTVTCENNQEPFCIVRDGKVDGRCTSSGGRRGESLQRWVLSEALGRPVSDNEWQAPKLQQALKSGSFVWSDEKGKDEILVSFRPLKDLQQMDWQRKPEDPDRQSGRPEACEVCVLVSGVNRCKIIVGKSEKELKAAAAELCQSNQLCLNRSPSIKCAPQ